MLATKFGNVTRINQDKPLTNDQLIRVAPSIFAVDKHVSRSQRYAYIPTIQVVEGLRSEGFMPFFACQSKSRIEGKSEFTKHMIRFRQMSQIMAQEADSVSAAPCSEAL